MPIVISQGNLDIFYQLALDRGYGAVVNYCQLSNRDSLDHKTLCLLLRWEVILDFGSIQVTSSPQLQIRLRDAVDMVDLSLGAEMEGPPELIAAFIKSFSLKKGLGDDKVASEKQLSVTEEEVFRLLAEGKTIKQIEAAVEMPQGAVPKLEETIRWKLGIPHRLKAETLYPILYKMWIT